MYDIVESLSNIYRTTIEHLL